MSQIDFQDFLLHDEKVMWSGRPLQGLLFTGKDVFLIPFSLLWGGFAVFWESTLLSQDKAPFLFKLWGIPFVLIGLYFIVGRFLVDAWIRAGMRYAITNKRVLISRSAPFSKFTAMSLDRLQEANLSQRADGRGTIRFGGNVSIWQRGNSFGSWTPALDPTPQFLMIENVRSVYEQLERAIHSGKSG